MMDCIDFIISSPYKQSSSSTIAYRKLYRRVIQLAVRELEDCSDGFKDPELIYQKRTLEKKLYKLRKMIPTNEERDKFRSTPEYKQRKINWYNKAVQRYLSLKNS